MAGLNNKWPDQTGFHFNLPPANNIFSKHNHDREDAFYSAYHVANDGETKYQQWGCWPNKFSPDPRFAAISDTNSTLHQFPEVEAPWSFDAYVFKATGGPSVIQPPLYAPADLTLQNGVMEKRTLRVNAGEHLEPLYKYKGASGKEYTQEQLESGVTYTIDGQNYRADKWIDPHADEDENRTFVRLDQYDSRRICMAPEINDGVCLRKVSVPASSVRHGQHGNVPAGVINMSGPREWMEPENLMKSEVVPVVRLTFGSPVYTTHDGIITYEILSSGVGHIWVQEVAYGDQTSPEGDLPRLFGLSEVGAEVALPRPFEGDNDTQLKTHVVATGFEDGDLVHRGCEFFVGGGSSCYCSIDGSTLPGEPTPVPNPEQCVISDDTYDGDCPYRSPRVTCEVATYETEAATMSEMAKTMASIESYDEGGGTANFVDGKSAMSMASLPLGGGALAFGMYSLGAMAANVTSTNGVGIDYGTGLPRSLGDTDMRMTVTYELVSSPSEGRTVVRGSGRTNANDMLKEGTGKFMIDSKSDSYGGVDANFFGGVNMMSASRMCSSVMPCYRADKCNKAYGPSMQQGYNPDVPAGVGDAEYCRYYNYGCPATEIPRRAYEYARKYSQLKEDILDVFRMGGLPEFSAVEKELGDGVFVAVAPVQGQALWAPACPDPSGYAIFMYDKGQASADHLDARVWAHIPHYDSDGNLLTEDYSTPSWYPEDDVPWLVELDDDYILPTKNATIVENPRPFVGGRHPEYKDMTARGEEVFCTYGAGGHIYGNEGGASGVGGEPGHAAAGEPGFLRGYWIDKTGEYIMDGRTLGTIGQTIPSENRTAGSPSNYGGATPIEGVVGNSIISPDLTKQAIVRRGWLYSSDTRDVLADPEAHDIQNAIGDNCRPLSPGSGLLPSERQYYTCSQCGVEETPGSGLNSLGEPVVEQIVTDWEYEDMEEKVCPRCGGILTGPTNWTSFPSTYAAGVVDVWGLPGQEIDTNGYYWRNPALVNRLLVSKILDKLGPKKEDGGGYKMNQSESANEETEFGASMDPVPSGHIMSQGIPMDGNNGFSVPDNEDSDDDGIMDFTRTDYSHNPDWPSSTEGYGDTRLDGKKYRDNLISNNDQDVDGLDRITINHLKGLRNKVQPIMGYRLAATEAADYGIRQQGGHSNRYGDERERSWRGKLRGVNPEIMAANTLGRDQYVQFWDGTLIPGRTIFSYFPTGPTWWRMNGYVGGISRDGSDEDPLHLDTKGAGPPRSQWYTGDELYSKAFFFPQGWLPMDKEVVKAYAIIKEVKHPDVPAVGIVWSGATLRQHYHAMSDVKYDDHTFLEGPVDTVIQMDDVIDGFAEEDYVSHMNHLDGPYYPFEGTPTGGCVASFEEVNHGYGTCVPVEYITWDKSPTQQTITQEYTEEEVWKRLDFADFREMLDRNTIKAKFVAGDPDMDGNEYEFSVFSQYYLEDVINNENQPIPGYFDLSGLNDSKMYPVGGPVFEDKVGDTSWAEGGHVVVRGEPQVTTANKQWSSGGRGNLSAGWKEKVLDITSLVKTYYDDRIDRVYKVATGQSWATVAATRMRERNSENFEDTAPYTDTYPPSKEANARAWNDETVSTLGSYMLNDDRNHPILSAGDVVEPSPGDLLALNPSGRVMDVTGFYVEDDVSEGDAEFYKYHPFCLCGTIPPSGVITSPNTLSTDFWLTYGSTPARQGFTMSLRESPLELSRKDWRHQKGRWNVSNAKCQNQDCVMFHYDMTVAEYTQFVQSQARSTGLPGQYSTRCVLCGDSLLPEDNIDEDGNEIDTGAVYEPGDGMLTVSYDDIPDHRPLVTCVEVSMDNTELDMKHPFSVEYLLSDGVSWASLFEVGLNDDGSKYVIIERGDNGSYSAVEKTNIGQAGVGEMFGVNRFIPKTTDAQPGIRTERVRLRVSPSLITLTKEGSMSGASVSGSAFVPGADLRQGWWNNGSLFFYNDGDEVDEDSGLSITSNTEDTVFVNGSPTMGSDKWMLSVDKYIAFCHAFRVYGVTSNDGEIVSTSSASVVRMPIVTGVTSIPLPETPTQICAVRAGFTDVTRFAMSESDSPGGMKWTAEESTGAGGDYYRLTAGEYYFDLASNSIVIPSAWSVPGASDGDPDGASGLIWTLNNGYGEGRYGEETIPTFIVIEYFTGNGCECETTATAIGSGPSYIVEKGSVCNIAGSEPENEPGLSDTPVGVSGDIAKIGGTITALPSMGSSIKLGSKFKHPGGKKDVKNIELSWRVVNTERMDGEFAVDNLVGNELPPGGWSDSDLASLFGGDDQGDAGLGDKAPSTALTGIASGSVILYGSPDTPLSGELYVYARSSTTRSVITGFGTNNQESEQTEDKTGGFKRTGFSVGVQDMTDGNGATAGRRGMCYQLPEVVIYLKDRDTFVSS